MTTRIRVKPEFESVPSLSGNTPNIVDVSSSVLDTFRVSEEDYIKDTVKLYSVKTNEYVRPIIQNYLYDSGVRFIKWDDYPLAATVSRDGVLYANLSVFPNRDVTLLTNRDLTAISVYALVFYNALRNIDRFIGTNEFLIQYYFGTLIRFYKRKSALSSSPELQQKLLYLTALYVNIAFFNQPMNYTTFKKEALSRLVSTDDVKLNFDFSSLSGFLDSIRENSIIPISLATFSQEVMKYGKLQSLPMFEDYARFLAVLFSSTVLGNTLVPSIWLSIRSDIVRKVLVKATPILSKV